jgi:DNA-binding MarR family transcriptional regulator
MPLPRQQASVIPGGGNMILKEMPSYQVLVDKMARYPEMDILVTESHLHVVRTGTILQNRIEQMLAKMGMSYGRFVVLGLLSTEREPMPVSKLADKSGVTAATISAVVSGMVRDGLVERHEAPSDRRLVCIGLSPNGQRKLDDILPMIFKWQAEAMAKLDPKELNTLIELLSKVNLDAPHRGME